MNCMVCGAVISRDVCPRCQFPVINIVGDFEENMVQLRQQANEYRQKLLDACEVSVMTYTWKETDGKLVQHQTVPLSFGRCGQIGAAGAWLEQRFARVTGENHTVALLLRYSDERERCIQVQLSCLPQAELQRVGLMLLDGLYAQLVLKNDTAQVVSEPFGLLPEDEAGRK